MVPGDFYALTFLPIQFVKRGAEDMLTSLGKIVLEIGSPRVRDLRLLNPIVEYVIEDFRREVEVPYNDARNYVEKLNSSRRGFYEYVGKYVKNLDVAPPVTREEVEKHVREIDEFLPIKKKVFEADNPKETVRRAERVLEEVENLFHRLGDPEPKLINSLVLKNDPLRELHEKRVIVKFDLEKVKRDLEECFKTYEEVLDAVKSNDENKLHRAREKLFALSDVCQSIIAEKIRRETGKDVFA